jgi:hypothetical protein
MSFSDHERPRVVGWLLHRDNICEECNERPAECIVTLDGIYSLETCRECLPPEHDDEIENVLRRTLSN